MLAAYESDLTPVEDHAWRVGDAWRGATELAASGSGSVSRIRRPPRVTIIAAGPRRSRAAEQRVDLALDRRALDRQLDRGRRALEPVQVLAERERLAVVEAHHLEHPVAPVEPVVAQRDRRLGRSA